LRSFVFYPGIAASDAGENKEKIIAPFIPCKREPLFLVIAKKQTPFIEEIFD
jgi:hypothetical protein